MAAGLSPVQSRLLNIFVCVGAAIVIIGALFKIEHYPAADITLPIGLGTEALIFLVYAILPPPDAGHSVAPVEQVKGNTALKTFEKMLSEADITPTSLSKLGDSFKKLDSTVANIGEIGDVVKSTSDFSSKAKTASESLSAITGVFNKTTTAFSSLGDAAESTKQFHGQVQTLTKNLSSINTIYELELQESNNHLKAINQFYGKLSQVATTMEGTAVDAVKAKEQISTLANNLSKLNQVYGNMLTAMQGRA
jgi:gliding motility-associated protein GldL